MTVRTSSYPYRRAVVVDDRPIHKTLVETLGKELASAEKDRAPLTWEELIQSITAALVGPSCTAAEQLEDIKGALEEAQRGSMGVDPVALADALLSAIGLDPDDVTNSVTMPTTTEAESTGGHTLTQLLEETYSRDQAAHDIGGALGEYEAYDGANLQEQLNTLEAVAKAMKAWEAVADIEESHESLDDIVSFMRGLHAFVDAVVPDGVGVLSKNLWDALRDGAKDGQTAGQEVAKAWQERGTITADPVREEALKRLRDRLLGHSEDLVTAEQIETMLGLVGEDEPEF